jgi:two-component system phosphate regulon sensor histidine kinase PhoR
MPVDDLSTADATAELFASRPPGAMPLGERAFVGVRFGRDTFTMSVPPATGHWQIFVEHRLGSLDAAVDQLRRRNLAVSFGVFLVLVGSVIMIIVASERARMLARLQMKFAAGVSHELRTPLAAIQALSYNLAAGIVKEPEQIRQYARMVQDEANGLTSMVDQVLLFAETRPVRKKYDVGPVEVVDVLDKALSALASQIRELGCNIITDIPDDLPVVRANATSLAHCVRNLVSNALKYGMKSGNDSSIRIAVSNAPDDAEVRIRVIDEGPGIDPSDWPHIFEPFYRGREAGSRARGAGLGLYLVRHLIEAQGGRVTADNNTDTGSTFTLHVPVLIQALRNGSPVVSG